MKELQKIINKIIDETKEQLLISEQLDYKYTKQPSVLTAHLKGYIQASEHILDRVNQRVELEEISDNIEAEKQFELEREGFKHDFPTR